jgi:hypothetical protein
LASLSVTVTTKESLCERSGHARKVCVVLMVRTQTHENQSLNDGSSNSSGIGHVSRAGHIPLFTKRASCCHFSQALRLPLDLKVTYDSRRVRFPTLPALYHGLTRPNLLWQVVDRRELIREKARAARGLSFITVLSERVA